MTIDYFMVDHFMSKDTQDAVKNRIRDEKERGDVIYTTKKSRPIAQEVFETLCDKYEIAYVKEEVLDKVTYKKA